MKGNFEPGMGFRAKVTLLAEGAHGSLSKIALDEYKLRNESEGQTYGFGIKEVWRIAPEGRPLSAFQPQADFIIIQNQLNPSATMFQVKWYTHLVSLWMFRHMVGGGRIIWIEASSASGWLLGQTGKIHTGNRIETFR